MALTANIEQMEADAKTRAKESEADMNVSPYKMVANLGGVSNNIDEDSIDRTQRYVGGVSFV